MAKSQRFAKVEVDDEDPEDVLARKIVVESQNMTLVILLIPSGWNQTTLGLGVKLHHKIGSRKLIDILHDHGYTTTS